MNSLLKMHAGKKLNYRAQTWIIDSHKISGYWFDTFYNKMCTFLSLIFFKKREGLRKVFYGSPLKISDLCGSTYNECVNRMKYQCRKDTLLSEAPSCWPFPLFCKVLKL